MFTEWKSRQLICYLENMMLSVESVSGDWAGACKLLPGCAAYHRQLMDVLQEQYGREGPSWPLRSGKTYWPLDPRPQDICLEDIAHSLAHIARFNGHGDPITVAQHSVQVSYRVSPEAAFLGLMHDATEAYLHDIISPLKQLLGEAYANLERKCWAVICEAFQIAESPETWAEVKLADLRSLVTEARDCFPGGPLLLPGPVLPYPEPTEVWSHADAKRAFLERFRELHKPTAGSTQVS